MTLLGIQAAEAAAKARLNDAQAEYNRRQSEATSLENISRKLQADITNKTWNNRVIEAERMAEYDRKTAEDWSALYNYYANYYKHKPGDAKTAYNFSRKYSWWYDPRHRDAADRETKWTNTIWSGINGSLGLVTDLAKVTTSALPQIEGAKEFSRQQARKRAYNK